MGGDENHFNVSSIVRDKVTRPCPQTTTFEETGVPKRIQTEVPLLTSLTARPNRFTIVCFFHGKNVLRPKAPTHLPLRRTQHAYYIYILKYRSCRETDAHAKKSPGSGRTSEFKINRYEAQTTKLEHSIRSYFVVVDLDL